MAETKTKVTSESVDAFIRSVEDEKQKQDCFALKTLLTKTTGFKPKMWGPSIIGFGSYHYRYESGHEGDICAVGLSPRKGKITLYLAPGFDENGSLLEKLGKVKVGKGCIYIKKLEDIDHEVLNTMVIKSLEMIKTRFGVVTS